MEEQREQQMAAVAAAAAAEEYQKKQRGRCSCDATAGFNMESMVCLPNPSQPRARKWTCSLCGWVLRRASTAIEKPEAAPKATSGQESQPGEPSPALHLQLLWQRAAPHERTRSSSAGMSWSTVLAPRLCVFAGSVQKPASKAASCQRSHTPQALWTCRISCLVALPHACSSLAAQRVTSFPTTEIQKHGLWRRGQGATGPTRGERMRLAGFSIASLTRGGDSHLTSAHSKLVLWRRVGSGLASAAGQHLAHSHLLRQTRLD